MGISGLIPFLEKASSKVHLRDLRGTTVAVDTYCWLHKGVFSCAEKLVRGEETDKYLQYCLKYVHMLLSYDIKPILVFDGRHLPAKAQTELRRRETRQASKRLAAEYLRAGRIEEARSHMRRCVDVTHEMALRLIRECHLRNVDCIVAPYEADAQLAWLNIEGLAQYVITEDSDLFLFGASNIIFKLDLTGAGLLIESDKLHLAMGCTLAKYTFDKFRRMCILSGCDYLDSLPGIGLAKACKFILKTEDDNMRTALKKIPAYLNMRQLDITDEYIEGFLKAEATFRHMYIYNPLERRMQRLNPLKAYETDESLCCNAGTLITDEDQALQLAIGNLNPFKLKQLDNWHPDSVDEKQALPKRVTRAKHKSIWSRNCNADSPDKPVRQHALIFKKIDFISKTVDEEVNESLSAECAKPAEADIFNMYRTVEKSATSISGRSDSGISVATPRKANRNPFAKSSEISPTVCENPSLLKVITPKRCQEKISQTPSPSSSTAEQTPERRTQIDVQCTEQSNNYKEQTPRKASDLSRTSIAIKFSPKSSKFQNKKGQGIKRSLFARKTETIPTVRSRFFQNINSISTKTTAEIKEFEIENSPIKKQPRLDVTTPENKDTTSADVERKTVITNTITLLSDDEDEDMQQNVNKKDKNVVTNKLLSYQKQPAPRIGLSKSKSTTKSSKNVKKSTTSSDTQSLLSKFGFQRKPVLK